MTRSPDSSYGVESVDGTPDTRLTAFSPEDAKVEKPYTTVKSTNIGANVVHDPFISDMKAKGEQKLSPTATSFQPYSLNAGISKSISSVVGKSTAPIPGTAQHLKLIIANEESSPRRRAQIGSSKFGQFTTETRAGRHVKIESLFKTEDISQVVKESVKKFKSSGAKGTFQFESVNGVVYMRISHRDDSLDFYNSIKKQHDNLEVVFIQPNEAGEIITPLARNGRFSAYEGQIMLQVDYPTAGDRGKFEADVRAYLEAEIGSLCAWEKISGMDLGTFCMVAEFYDTANDVLAFQQLNGKTLQTRHRPKLFVSLHRPSSFHKSPLSRTSNGATAGLNTPTSSPGLCDGISSMSVDKGKAPAIQGGYVPFATPIQTSSGLAFMPTSTDGVNQTGAVLVPSSTGFSPTNMSQYAYSSMSSPQMVSPQSFGMSGFGSYNGSHQGMSPVGYMGFGQMIHHASFAGPSGYYEPPTNFGSPSHFGTMSKFGSPAPSSAPFGYIQRSPARRENASKVPHSGARGYRHDKQDSSASHNQVDPHSILWGLDVRTTVMLRNIPNKCSQEELKAIVDQSSAGKYDFMYLRIDFSNECNVGYAFVNFIDPIDIVDFFYARSGERWENYRSDKRAEVSYATIQGRDCLIQKFRNSSVMLEPEHCRPKLYYVSGPLCGQEEPFPLSDNPSKLQRSCQNAEHVGLFAPSAGQHLRNEQRHRRSQYDRGTTMAEQEEFQNTLEWPSLPRNHQSRSYQ